MLEKKMFLGKPVEFWDLYLKVVMILLPLVIPFSLHYEWGVLGFGEACKWSILGTSASLTYLLLAGRFHDRSRG